MARRKHPQRKPREPRVSAQAAAPAPVAPNYAYWREHGREWPEEYDQRKKQNLAYHVQEIMLSEYFAHSAPARVLEVGCGPGRHLRYLNDLPGIQVHGYDQSASMAEGVRRWASEEWFAERVVVGEPTGRLPYADRSFDVVFTAEVLVHVRPEDLEGVLAELVRVASWQVLHLETSHDWELHQVAHEGCWKHDLVAAYARLGLVCELLPRGYTMHTPHRVVLDRKRRLYTWPTGPVALLARMEAEIGRGWQEVAGQCEQERKRADGAEARAQGVGDRVSELIRQLDEARQRARQAEARGEAQLGRVQTLSDALEKQTAAARERAAADAAARQKQEDRAREAEARGEALLGRIQSLSEALDKQITAAQERAAKDAETRQRLEERSAALESRAGDAVARLGALQEQVEKERARAREAEARGEAWHGRLESMKEALAAQMSALQERAAKDGAVRQRLEEQAAALGRQLAASQERLTKDGEARQRLEEQAAALGRQLAASQERLTKDGEARQRLEEQVAALGRQLAASQERLTKDAEARQRLEERVAEIRERESRIAALQSEVEQERRRARDAEARSELHVSRIQETKGKLAEQVAQTQQVAAQLAELRKRHESAFERAKGAEERLEQERRRARDAEGRCELYLARVAETRTALESQTAAVGELERRATELERDYETALAEEGKRSTERSARLEARTAEASARAEELAGLLTEAREELQRIARERAAARREEDAKRRRLAEQLKAVEARHASLLSQLGERLGGPGLPSGAGADEAERLLLDRVQEVSFELGYVKQRASYRLLRRLRRTLAYRVARWLPRRNRDVVTVRALGTRSPGAGDCEVWLLAARSEPGGPAVPWDFMAQRGAWHRRPDPRAPYGEVLMSKRGRLRFSLHGETPVLTFLKHPWSGRVEVRFAGRREVFDLHSPRTEGLDLYPAQQPMALPAQAQPEPPPAGPAAVGGARVSFHEDDRRWLEGLERANARVVALHVPRWLGVTSSTRILFEHVLAFPRSAAQEPYHLGEEEIRYNAELILASGVRHVVASGGDEIHFKVLREVKRRDPGIRCDLLWHASYVQMTEDYQWALLRTWVEGARAGIVDTVGTVKQGMERFFEHAGIRSRFVMNWVPEIPSGPSTPREGGPHLGMWISGNSYRKLPYAMLAAVKMVPGAVLHGSNFVKRVRDAIDLFEIPVHRSSQAPLPQDEMLQAIRDTHLTLYVTFSECSPMLPLESFSVGTPCLVGPTSHLFEDDEFLRSRLVVPAPDRADVIAQWIERALAERDALVRAYQRWAPQYNARARASLDEFLRD